MLHCDVPEWDFATLEVLRVAMIWNEGQMAVVAAVEEVFACVGVCLYLDLYLYLYLHLY